MISEGKSTATLMHEFLERQWKKNIHLTGIFFGSPQTIWCVKP